MKITGKVKESEHHFSDVKTEPEDIIAGTAIAFCIGDTFITCNHESPAEQWTEIMKALRVHGIKITL